MAPVATTMTRPTARLQVKGTYIPRKLIEPQVSKTFQEEEARSTRPMGKDVITDDPPISHQQSFELVQTLLLVSFASVCYLRNLLPEECFEDRDYATVRSGSYWPYKQFFHGNIIKSGLDETTDSQKRRTRKLKVLTPGKTAAADKLLFWLNGIFEALSRSFLSAVQLSIVLDKDHISKVIESYTFSFKYIDTASIEAPGKRLQGMMISGSHGRPVTINNARAGLETISRYLIQLTQYLPDLPATRFLTVHIAYTNDCPIWYNPPGFLATDADDILVPNTTLWKMQEVKIGQMDTGFHSVKLAVAHLSAVHDEGAESGDDVPIPSNISYTREIPRFDQRLQRINRAYTSSSNQVENVFSSEQDSRIDDINLNETIPATRTGEQRPTCDPENLINEKLLGMIETQKPADDLVPTQPYVEERASSTTWKLNGTKSSELALRRDAFLQQNLSRPTLPSQNGVLCECGYNTQEGVLVQCDCCDKMQHRHCYALERRELDETHVCYTCLLESAEPTLLERVKSLVQLRKALWAMRSQGIPSSKAALARLITHDSKQATQIISRLKDNGFLADAPGSHTKGFRNKRLPPYHLAKAIIEENMRKDGMLHPLSLIGHHYISHHDRSLLEHGADVENTLSAKGLVQLESVLSDRSGNETETTEGETDELLGVATQLPDPTSIRRKIDNRKAAKSIVVPNSTDHKLRPLTINYAPQNKRHSGELEISRKRARTATSPMDASDMR